MTLISLKNLDVTIGKKQILKNIDLEVEKGSVTVFIGPSRSGKTTLLRTINLLQKPSQGILRISNTEVDTSKLSKNAIREIRQYSTMIFQSFNLFKNFTVLENVYRPLILNGKYSKSEAKEIALQALKDVGLEKFASQYPATLSGGQQQRVAIARAVAFHPEVILFDEPTSSLDPEMVESVLQVIVNLAKKNITMILVTHEMEFARKIADKAVFIENGEILTQGDAKILLSNEGSHDRVRSFVNSLYRGTPESAEL
ncbi:amino acid ABC transporter ATP-binding protein [Streptococcus thermophilus]|uniref:amino acid ABC transporter ATP-binding protein n=1 Tax=Streptococcus thermophilus TaxID=1308 RepID=UPI0015C2B067|nr:amino acid ABC transporter ATP-binding protein [Streptococcus thermophilus]MCE2119983.1 ATP-binding cassette domain-containing protein [Streptococcus thermophilus]MCT2935866.1 amino acid ABC transporter ATP-binding protein [Streptococcus thermophilus]CAD0142908.1 putative sulfur aminoacid ABC transporter (ATP-binding protein) [Streptococcus thermophilus]